MPLDDVARFRPDDPEPLVAASFLCPLCLAVEVTGELLVAGEDSEVICSCAGCDAVWSVALDPAQLMRLVLHPPAPHGDGWALRVFPHYAAGTPWRS